MNEVWENGRLPRVADWFDRILARRAFQKSILEWVPEALREEMLANGRKTWPQIRSMLEK